MVKVEEVVKDLKKELSNKHNITITTEELKKHIQDILDEKGIVNPITLKQEILNEIKEAKEQKEIKENASNIKQEETGTGENPSTDTGTDTNYWDEFFR